MFIDRQTLEHLDACDDYLDAFDVLFPDGVLVTTELCVRHYDDFLWGWAVEELLSSDGHRRYWQAYDPEVNAEVAEFDRRRERINKDWQTFVTEWSARHNVNTRRMYWRDVATPNAIGEYERRFKERCEAHQVVERHLAKIRARIFGELADAYEANRVRWATEETRLSDIYDREAYLTTTTPTTAPTPSSDLGKNEQGELTT